MTKFIPYCPLLAQKDKRFWIVEDGQGSAKILPPNHNSLRSDDLQKDVPVILEPKWVPTEPVYFFPLDL
jgi:hypothetical protein